MVGRRRELLRYSSSVELWIVQSSCWHISLKSAAVLGSIMFIVHPCTYCIPPLLTLWLFACGRHYSYAAASWSRSRRLGSGRRLERGARCGPSSWIAASVLRERLTSRVSQKAEDLRECAFAPCTRVCRRGTARRYGGWGGGGCRSWMLDDSRGSGDVRFGPFLVSLYQLFTSRVRGGSHRVGC